MKHARKRHQVIDTRAGYQRQEQERATITCECGAEVLEGRNGQLVHVGRCTKKEGRQ